MKSCIKCNKKLTKKYQIKFCSKSCSASFNNLKRPSKLKPEQISKCLNCDKIIIRKPNEIKKGLRIYCSINCSNEYKKNLKLKERKKLFSEGKLKLRSQLRKLVLERDGHICSCCRNTMWLDKPIPLWLDHIDGNASNNFSKNLRLMCLNCDALGDTFGNRNRGKGRRSIGLKPWQ